MHKINTLLYLAYVPIIIYPEWFIDRWPHFTIVAIVIPVVMLLFYIGRERWREKHNYRAYVTGKNEHYWKCRRASFGNLRNILAKARNP